MRNIPPETTVAEALAAVRDDLIATLAGLPPPPALVEAEALLIEAREKLADSWSIYRALIRENGRTVTRTSVGDAEIHRAKGAVDQSELAVSRAQIALNEQRQAHGRTIAAAIERHQATAAAAIAGAAQIFADVEAAAAAGYFALPSSLVFTPGLSQLAAEANRAVAWHHQQRQTRFDRDFSKAAAAMSARRMPMPAAPETSWTGSINDAIGVAVVDAPVPQKPGSAMMTERLAVPVGSYGLSTAAAAIVDLPRSFLKRR